MNPLPLSFALAVTQGLPEGSILQFDKTLLVNLGIQLINVAVLTVVLVHFLYKPVKNYMSQRSERIQNEMESARGERAKALELKEQYEQRIAEVEKEREEILHQAYKKAMDKSDQMLFDARREAEAAYSRALAELETERKNQENEMRRQIIEISVMVAERLVSVSIDRETHDRYIDEALAEWEEKG